MAKDRKISSLTRPTGVRSVTIKDLAAELELSITTISRALNGYTDVGEKTRKRVEEAAQRVGYRPNRNAQRLVTQRTHSFAWVQADNDRKFVDPHFVEVMSGALRAARGHNYDLVLTSALPDQRLSAYDRYVRDNSVDGFMVDLPQPDDPCISFLLDAHRPFVVHGREERADQYGWVDIDNFGNFYDLTRLMIANGHRHIAFINGDETYSFAIARRKGAEAAVRDMGLAPDSLTILSSVHPMTDAGFQLTEQAINLPGVSALLYSSTLMAVEGYAAIARGGRKVDGVDLAVGTMDDDLHFLDITRFDGQFTYVRSSLRDAGAALIAELIRECEDGQKPAGTIIPSSFHCATGMDASILDTPRLSAET